MLRMTTLDPAAAAAYGTPCHIYAKHSSMRARARIYMQSIALCALRITYVAGTAT